MLAALPFLVEVCYVFVAVVWEAELLAVRVRAGCIGLAMVMKLMSIVLSILLIPLFLLYYSFVGVLSPQLMFLKVSGARGLLNLGGMLYRGIGVLFVVMVRVVLSPHFILGIMGFLRISMASTSGCLIP